MENVKKKILLFVQSIGLSKAEIARQLGISKSNFVGEAMASDLNVSMVIKFCQLYPQVSAEWLLRGEGSMLRSTDAKPNNVINFGHHNSNNNVGGTHTIVTKSAQQLPTMTREEAITALINQNTDLIKLLKNK